MEQAKLVWSSLENVLLLQKHNEQSHSLEAASAKTTDAKGGILEWGQQTEWKPSTLRHERHRGMLGKQTGKF